MGLSGVDRGGVAAREGVLLHRANVAGREAQLETDTRYLLAISH
jgi:hypothetical protein